MVKGLTAKETRELSGVLWMLYILIVMIVTWLYTVSQNSLYTSVLSRCEIILSINYTYRSLKVELFQPKYFHKHCLFASIQNTFLDKYYYKTNKLYLWFFLMFNLDAVKLYAFSILFYSSAEHKFIQLKLGVPAQDSPHKLRFFKTHLRTSVIGIN